MSLAITGEHRQLAGVSRTFLRERGALAAARDLLDADEETLPRYWVELVSMGWTGLHLPEDVGGQGFGLPELAIVLEESGRVVAPGPLLPTVLASAVIAEASGGDSRPLQKALLPPLAEGSRVGAVASGGRVVRDDDGAVSGDGLVAFGGRQADVLLVVVGEDVAVLDLAGTGRAGTQLEPLDGLDRSRRPVAVQLDRAQVLGWLPQAAAVARRHMRVLAAAEAVGIAAACLDQALEYVKQREQFGRPVGTFQAVKHHCANLLMDTELAVAAAWDAARAPIGSSEAELAAAVAAVRSVPAAVRAAEMAIQLHGGIGFTWEHDAHLYLRRAMTLAAMVDQAGDPARDVTRLMAGGVRRTLDIDLPDEAEGYRDDAHAFVASLADLGPQDRRRALVETGYLVPHWPPPFGRGAGAVEQLVIEQELADVDIPNLGITGWVIQTIAQHGSEEQVGRWVKSTLLGDISWCQMFSEPGAGSDAAAIRTRAVRVDGGWRVSGQKVWTTRAHEADWGFATVRTDPPGGPKHSGVTMMAIDMRSPGVDVRPLREITGGAEFNEVFLDEVFVPDADVVGEVGQGWRVARATLGNERVSIGSRGTGSMSTTAPDLLDLIAGSDDPDRWSVEVGELLAEDLARRILLLRFAARAVDGADPGPEGNLAKLVASEHVQRVTRLGMRIACLAAVTGRTPQLTTDYLWARCQTIAGGTSEIARNQIAERILGLPREPALR